MVDKSAEGEGGRGREGKFRGDAKGEGIRGDGKREGGFGGEGSAGNGLLRVNAVGNGSAIHYYRVYLV